VILGGLAAAETPLYERSTLEIVLGVAPGYLKRELQTVKTLLIVSTAATVGLALVSLAFTRR
jgi:hypothetical protein